MWPIAARVAWTVCLSVGCERETHQTYEPIWMPSRMWTLKGKKNHVLPGSPDPPPWNGDKTWACPDMPAVYIVYLISKDSSDAAFGYRYLLHSTTRCKARLGCSPPRLLIIVDSSVNWFACVQRECQINVWGRKVRFHGGGQCPFTVYWCCQQKSSRSTSCITLTTVEPVLADYSNFMIHRSLWRK